MIATSGDRVGSRAGDPTNSPLGSSALDPRAARRSPAGSAGAGALVGVSHLSKSYRSRPAVRDVSVEIAAGVTGLLGPNGAGKTTLLRCIAGLSGWDAGAIRIEGVDLARRPREARRRIGFMPERVALPLEMTVGEYLRFVAEIKVQPRSRRAGAVDEVLGQVGLCDVSARIIGNLSKGYRQRVGLAQALLGDASVIALDEPSAGLDPLSVIDLRGVLREAARDRAVLVSTHLLPEARLLCDRVIVMSHGRVVYDGSAAGMVAADGGRLQFRVRVQGRFGEAPLADVPGVGLLHRQDDEREHLLVVEATSEADVGTLVTELVAGGWTVIGVEPTEDALERAFRDAVVGGS